MSYAHADQLTVGAIVGITLGPLVVVAVSVLVAVTVAALIIHKCRRSDSGSYETKPDDVSVAINMQASV